MYLKKIVRLLLNFLTGLINYMIAGHIIYKGRYYLDLSTF
jgi:hypothetical protein